MEIIYSNFQRLGQRFFSKYYVTISVIQITYMKISSLAIFRYNLLLNFSKIRIDCWCLTNMDMQTHFI